MHFRPQAVSVRPFSLSNPFVIACPMLPIVPQSFGDIVAAAELAFKIYKALSDSAGSPYQYRCLIEELSAFRGSLESADAAIRRTPLSGEAVVAIKAEARLCRELLQKFWDRISPYEGRLNRGGIRGFLGKLRWYFGMSDEVKGFRSRLAAHQRTITIFLASLEL